MCSKIESAVRTKQEQGKGKSWGTKHSYRLSEEASLRRDESEGDEGKLLIV